MSILPEGTLDAAAAHWEGAMTETLTAWAVEADTGTPDKYDTTKTELYGPNTSPYEGKASVSEDTTTFARSEDGDEELDADAVVTLPLIGAGLETRLLDKPCEATFRGRTKEGRILRTARRDVTVQLLVEWT